MAKGRRGGKVADGRRRTDVSMPTPRLPNSVAHPGNGCQVSNAIGLQKCGEQK
jgi:hypothetical protein